jgi:hypothetical protein
MPQDPCLPKRRSGQRLQQGFRPAVNPLQDLAGFESTVRHLVLNSFASAVMNVQRP